MTCVACDSKSCFTHDSPWHEGQTCDEFTASSFVTSFATSLKLITDETKACPRCKTRIFKVDGCEHVWTLGFDNVDDLLGAVLWTRVLLDVSERCG
jgi:hypothetical protein